jgi:hypothetical protein
MEIPLELQKIELGPETLKHLNTARKWAMFLAIISFILVGLVSIIGLIAGTFFKTFSAGEKMVGVPDSLVYIPMIAMAVIYFFPVLFLFRFSKFSHKAILTFNKDMLHKAIKNLKYYFAYIGILIIVIVSLYIVVLIVAGSSIALLKGL